MKDVQTKVTRLEDANYQAFKQAQRAKTQAHAALVKEVRRQTRKAARDCK
jgi:hypothetical protein